MTRAPRALLESHAGRYLLALVIAFAGTGAVSIMTANALGPVGKGAASLLLVAATVGGSAATLGLDLSLCRTVAARPTSESPVTAMLVLVVGIGLALGASMAAGLSLVADVGTSGQLLLTAGLTAALAALIFSTNLLVGIEASAAVLSSRILGTAATVVCAAALLIAGAAVEGVVIAYAAGTALTFGLQARAFARGRADAWRWRVGGARRALASGLRVHAGTVIQTLSYRADFVIIAALLGTRELGIYSVAVMVSQLLWFVPDALGLSLFQRVAARSGAADGPILLRRSLARANLTMMIGAATLAAVAWLFLEPAFGPGFGAAYEPLLLLLPGVVALGSWKVMTTYLFARGHDFSKTIGAAVGAGTSIALDFVLIPPFGLNGAAIAASAAYVLAMLSAVVELRLRERVGVPALVGARPDRAS